MPIEHVVVLALENRSFDHLLGFLLHPEPAFAGLSGPGPYENPGWDGGPPVPATPDGKDVLPFGPGHSHDAVLEQLALDADGTPTNQGFVISAERTARGMTPPPFGGLLGPLLNRLFTGKPAPGQVVPGRGPLVMRCQPGQNVPVLSRLAVDFAVCDHWFCSVPGETWPNRNFLHAATSDGETNIAIRPYTDRTIFELLEDHGHRWRVYHDDTPQVWAFPRLWSTPDRHGNWFPITEFAVHAAAGDLPAYSFLEPNHRPPLRTGGTGASNSQHPENNLVPNDAYDTYADTGDTDFDRGERLVATIYEALRANPALFARTMLIITYDEHGGLYDHVPPPTGVPAPGDRPNWWRRISCPIRHRRATTFDFTMLGPRVPAVLVSPLVPPATVDSRVRDHASVPATLRALFAPTAAPLTARDAWSTPFHDLATLAEPRTDLPDLSDRAALAAPLAALPSTVTPDATATGPVPADVPDYYEDFLHQAADVRDRLTALGEPEMEHIPDTTPTPLLGAEITLAFAQAAHRHRVDSSSTDPDLPSS